MAKHPVNQIRELIARIEDPSVLDDVIETADALRTELRRKQGHQKELWLTKVDPRISARVVVTIRSLLGLGLMESKNVFDRCANGQPRSLGVHFTEVHLSILRENGCEVAIRPIDG